MIYVYMFIFKNQLTECIGNDILQLILDKKSDPRLLGKIVSLTGVFYFLKEED